jgi:hypothetical protein
MAALSPPSLHDGPYMMAALSPPSLHDGAIIVLLHAIISKQFIEQIQQWHETKQQDSSIHNKQKQISDALNFSIQ